MFLHPQIPDFQILSKPHINGNIIYSAFRLCINLNFTKLTLKTGFVLQDQKYPDVCVYRMSVNLKDFLIGNIQLESNQILLGI